MMVLFVCTGNICRSPMAEAIARRLLGERGRTDIAVSSAGTAASLGAPASEGAYLVGLEKGLDLSHHVARQLTPEAVESAALVLGMSRSHVERAISMGGAGKAFLLGEYAGKTADEAEVEDPFGGNLDDYREVYARLEALLGSAVERLVREHDGPDDGRAA